MTMEYLNTKNNAINSLRPLLIEAFVKFYGENYRYKITKLINDVIVVSVARSELNNDIDRKLSNLRNKENNFEVNLGIEYYNELKNNKKNSDSHYVFMTSTSSNNLDFAQSEIKRKRVICSGWIIAKQDTPMIFIVGIKNKYNYYYSQINHLITEDVLGKKYDDEDNYIESVRTHGIHSKGFTPDLVYEIINELMTQKILEIFMSEYFDKLSLEDKQLVTYHTNNKYLDLDRCSFHIVRDIYNKMESVIKNSFITGSGSTIQKIIGEFNYDELRMFLIENKRNLYKYMETHDDVSGYKSSLSPKVILECQRIKSNINKSYQEYLEYMVNLNSYVDLLVNDNKGRKIN